MKAVTKYQAETAEQTLRSALDEKRNKVMRERYEKAVGKYNADVHLLVVKAQNLLDKAVQIKNKVEKDSRLKVNIDNYNLNLVRIPEEIRNSLISMRKERYEGDNGFCPDYSKEEKEIRDFVLGLKLGTAVMTDMNVLLDKIKAL